MCKLFDAHNHLHLETIAVRGAPKAIPISDQHHPRSILEHLRQNQIRCATSATREEDWETLRKLWNDFPDTITVGLGIHPWWCDQVSRNWEQRLRDFLKENSAFFVGECGLDAFRAARHSGISLQKQIEVLEMQLNIAQETGRPVILHCVRAWKYIRDILKQFPHVSFAIHRFKGSAEDILGILDAGGYISLHRDSLEHHDTRLALSGIDPEKILIETDYDGPRVEALPIAVELRESVRKLASLMHAPEEHVADLTRKNAEKFYDSHIA